MSRNPNRRSRSRDRDNRNQYNDSRKRERDYNYDDNERSNRPYGNHSSNFRDSRDNFNGRSQDHRDGKNEIYRDNRGDNRNDRDYGRGGNNRDDGRDRNSGSSGREFGSGGRGSGDFRGAGGGRGDFRGAGGGREDFRGAGGGRGGGFGGRGRGGGGRNPHMGENAAFLKFVSDHKSLLDDAACSDIMDLSIEDMMQREEWIKSEEAIPLLMNSRWRHEKQIGLQLQSSKQHIVRSNFFPVISNLSDTSRKHSVPCKIFHYNVSIFKYLRVRATEMIQTEDGEVSSSNNNSNNSSSVIIDTEDLAKDKDKARSTELVKIMMGIHDEWRNIGIAYDGNSSLFSSNDLNWFQTNAYANKETFIDESEQGVVRYCYNIQKPNQSSPSYLIRLMKVTDNGILVPQNIEEWTSIHNAADAQVALQGLDVALLSFGRWAINDDKDHWILSGNKVFKQGGVTYDLGPSFIAMLGYNASLKSCLSGLVLVKDISVTCFMRGGGLIDLVRMHLNIRDNDIRQLENLFRNNRQTYNSREMSEFSSFLKNCKIKTTHLNHAKKFRGFDKCPALKEFTTDSNQLQTIADYFHQKHLEIPNVYPALKYPYLPTVEVGSKTKSILIPMELCVVVAGQTRKNSQSNDISGQIIKYAAQLPNERFKNISTNSDFFKTLQGDEDANAFGLAKVTENPIPMRVIGTILPPAKLQYGSNSIIEPKLTGTWNLAGGIKFAYPAPKTTSSSKYKYGCIFFHDRNDRTPIDMLERFLTSMLQNQSNILGIPLDLVNTEQDEQRITTINYFNDVDGSILSHALEYYKRKGVRFVLVMLSDPKCYNTVKRYGDNICLPTQCCLLKNIRNYVDNNKPRNYDTTLCIKINMKMGGVNHTLASRIKNIPENDSFQKPPKSIAWMFDVPTMVVGVDVNHPDTQTGEHSIVALVASMDGMMGQYAAHIATCTINQEPVYTLQLGMEKLLARFCIRNGGKMPENIIIYRDGISESQFTETLDNELQAFRNAINERGFSEDQVKITIIVCQKRHSTRLVYQESEKSEYINPCVGLCVDAQGSLFAGYNAQGNDDVGCIVGNKYNEFYLNSHAAILGTSKCTKYVILRDEIGITISELELLTFWLTHLYCRCTRSVSIATPAYYAHWAARRGKQLLQGGLNPNELMKLSERWMEEDILNSMYFL